MSEKKQKSRKPVKVWEYYELEGDKVKRLRKECPRCGKGTFLAEHNDRFTCGKCNYTQFKK